MTSPFFRTLLAAFTILSLGIGCANAGPAESDVQDFINRKEKNLATRVGSAHKSVTVAFESIKFGKQRTANEKDRIVNGITGSTVFPARVKYVSNRVWGNGETEAQTIHYEYEFFQNDFGEWDAYLVGPVN